MENDGWPRHGAESSLSAPSAGRLKLGAVSYLNTVPLIRDLGALSDRFDLVLDLPSRLSQRLEKGELAAALIPIFDVLESQRYTIVSDACIGCRGPVWSVKLLSRCPIGEIKTVALDEGSRTSVALVRILLRHYWRVEPTFQTLPITEDYRESLADAVMIIGDRAMHDDTGFHEHHDLGSVWHQWTGLPFVFAVWATEKSGQMAILDQHLSAARDRGLMQLESIVDEVHEKYGLGRDRCRQYLGHHLNFCLGDEERQAIQRFAGLAAADGLLPSQVKVKFYDFETVG